MAQNGAGGQEFPLVPPFPGGTRIVPHPGQVFTLGLTKRLALHLGHFAFMSLISVTLGIASQTKGKSASAWRIRIPIAMRSPEIASKKPAVTGDVTTNPDPLGVEVLSRQVSIAANYDCALTASIVRVSQ
jgi:hypothetical protein